MKVPMIMEKDKNAYYVDILPDMDKFNIFFYALLKAYIKDKTIDENNFQDKIKQYKKSKNMTHLKAKMLELLLYLNPKTENFKTELNKNYIINILKYLVKKKGDKDVLNHLKQKEKVKEINSNEALRQNILAGDEIEQNEEDINAILLKMKEGEINAEEILKICSKIFEEDKLYKILFNDLANLSNKKEYIEMMLLFLPDKDTQQILNVINNNLIKNNNKNQIMDFCEKTFRKLNFKNEFGFLFLKKVLIKFLEDKNNIFTAVENIENEFIFENKMLRCTKCFALPTFLITTENIINITYKCNHIQSVENSKLQEITEYKFKCNCNKFILKSNKNYICSNCNSIVCPLCSTEHFEKCGSIFFIEISEIEKRCLTHNEIYDAYCGICELNLCEKCRHEHIHTTEKEKVFALSKENLNQFYDIISKNNKTNNLIILAIQNIIEEYKFLKNFKFLHFIKKTLGSDTIITNKLFDELFSDEFNDYYSFMINQIKNGNYYFLNVLSSFESYYNKIDQNYQSFIYNNNYKSLKKQVSVMNKNNKNISLLSKYFKIIYDLRVQKQLFHQELEIKKGLINIEENKILNKLISCSEALYQKEIIKLIDRSIADNIIVYLIENFPNYFKKLDLNISMYADMEKYYKNDKEKFDKIKSTNKDKIETLFKNSEENSNTINKNKITFEKSIRVGKELIDEKELNQMLQFLFYMKEPGNYTAHPSRKQQSAISFNSHALKTSKNNDDINKIREKLEKLLKEERTKTYFKVPIKPKALFDCLFDNKFKPLISNEIDNEKNSKIENMTKESLDEAIIPSNMEKLFENYKERIKQLEEIREELKQNDNIEKESLEPSKSLDYFFNRLDKLLDNEKKCFSFLNRLNGNSYETSVTGENYMLCFYCSNYMIKKILPKLDKKICDYQNDKQKYEDLIQSKEQIISFLSNLNQKMDSKDELNESIIDQKEFKTYLNKTIDNSEFRHEDFKKIRYNLGLLVTESMDWTKINNLKLSTLLFLKQNNYAI